MSHVRRGDSQANWNFCGRHGSRGQRGKTSAGLMTIFAEPVIGFRDPKTACEAGIFSLSGIGLNGGNGFVGFENDAYFRLRTTHRVFS